ncbi:hypothetical protein K9L63_02320 [Candidatus Gracilibacteria bacterium]|nr:hypothetical protein [Candidatus Gracilibacteria bacterium]
MSEVLDESIGTSEEAVSLGRFIIQGLMDFVRQKVREYAFLEKGKKNDHGNNSPWNSLVSQMNVQRESRGVGSETVASLQIYRLRVLEALKRAETQKGEPLEGVFEVPAHVHFWLQALREKDPFKLTLEYDSKLNLESNAVHEAQPQYREMVSQCMRALIQNLSELEDQFGARSDEISEILKTQSLLIVTNHDTWLTQLFTTYLMQKTLPNFDVSQNKMLIGPALTTFGQLGILNADIFARAFSDVILTLPDTERGRPPEIDKKQISMFLTQTLRLLSEASKGQGNAVHLAPSGTTDIKNNGHIQLVPPAHSTQALLAKFHERMSILPIGFNAGNTYQNGKGIPRRGRVQMRMGDIIPPGSFQKENIGPEVMNQIAGLVVNNRNDVVGIFDPSFVKHSSS